MTAARWSPPGAGAAPVTVGGQEAYGVHVAPGTGYRDDGTSGAATGDQPEGEYAIFDGTNYPMSKEGVIILGTGGDNSDGAAGTFYEGVMTSGYPSPDTESAVQASIVVAGYAP